MQFFQRLSISQRLLTLLGIAALGTVIMVSYMLYTLKGVLVEEEKRKLDAVVSTALTILSDYHERAETGAMTEAEAMSAAFAQLDAIRYEGNEYVFTLKANGNLVQHPFTKQLVNTDVRSYEDPNGTRLFSDMISRTRNQDWAAVEYVWQKGESADNLVPKISRVASFRPWQLIVGTGQYTDNITAMLWSEFLKLSAFAIVLAVPLLLVFVVIIRSITRPLRQTIVAMNDIASGEGDLTRRLDAHGTDEISLLGKAFNHFVANIQSLVRTVQQSAEDEQAAAETLNELTGQSSAISSQLTDQSSSVATAVTELSASATEVAAHARTAAESANKADEEAGRSAVIVRQAVNNIQALTDELSTATGQAEILSKGSDRIGNILDVIVAIAEQTNLLALNAAIEAARAGEHGRGFAVVADEVRTLATRTQKSTDEIGDIVKNIQQAIIDVSRIITAVQERSTATTEEALQAETAISQIQEAVANISSMNIQIASATDEQSRVTMDLNHNITDISDLSLNNQDGNKQLERVSQDLSTNSKQLGDLVQRFKTD